MLNFLERSCFIHSYLHIAVTRSLISPHRNDAVVPLHESHAGCPEDANGLCSFDHVVEVLKKRSAEIDFDYDCYANYTAKAGVDYNGRAPRA